MLEKKIENYRKTLLQLESNYKKNKFLHKNNAMCNRLRGEIEVYQTVITDLEQLLKK